MIVAIATFRHLLFQDRAVGECHAFAVRDFSPLFLCSLLAGLAVYGLAHAPQADAQYPGGDGNYPGAGWHPIKPAVPPAPPAIGNDPLGDPNVYSSYDWTLLDDIRLDGSHGKYMEASEGGLGMIGGGNPGSATYTIKGLPDTPGSKSTIKFQWVVPNNAAGQPDLTDYPMPPLFVLGSITPTVSLSYVATGSDNRKAPAG